MSIVRFTLACAIVVAGGASFAQGAFSYGNLNGTNVLYQHIMEDSTTHPGTQLFGQPSISGDSLLFSPVSFGLSTSGGAFDIMDGTLTTNLIALGDHHLEEIRFWERGDYSLAGSGTTGTWAAVSAALFVRITELDGNPLTTPITKMTNFSFSPSDGNYNLIDDPGMTVLWEGGTNIDLMAMVVDAGLTGFVTKADITLDNQLIAFSESGTISYIKKKQMDGVSITAVIPEPATLSLLALGGLALLRRRR